MNSTDKHTDETLERLITTHSQNLSSTELCDFLLNSFQFAKDNDVDGWKTRFQPPPPPPQPRVKRQKQSPALAPYLPQPLCKGCKSENVIDDVPNGQIVCTACGLIQQLGVCTADIAHCSLAMMKETARVNIHHYSRVVYFMSVVRLLQGESTPLLGEEDLSRMRAEVAGKLLTVEAVNVALRKLGLARQFRKHRWTLLKMLGGFCPYKWDGRLVLDMAKQFRQVEFHWLRKRKRLMPKRVFFFSYPFLLHRFLSDRGLYAPPELLLKGELQRQKQISSYELLQQSLADDYKKL